MLQHHLPPEQTARLLLLSHPWWFGSGLRFKLIALIRHHQLRHHKRQEEARTR